MDKTDTESHIVEMNLESDSKANKKKPQCKEISDNFQAIGDQLEEREETIQRTFLIKEKAEDPNFDEYYDIEEKYKDENEDEASRAVLNKKANTYVRTQASSPIGIPALQRSYREDSARMYSAARLTGQQ